MNLSKRRLVVIFLFILVLALFFGAILLGFIGPNNNYSSYNAFPGISLDQPTGFVQAPGDSSLNYVMEKEGKIIVFPNRMNTNEKHVFLDISNNVTTLSNEDGLLGLTFHPNFTQNGKFYTFHSEPKYLKYNVDCEVGDTEDFCVRTVLSEFQVSQDNPLKANSSSQRELLEVNQVYGWHRAGQLHFGSDGFLYVHIGDGTNGTNARNLSNIKGTIIRIDVDHQDPGLEYAIPADNPFVGMNNTRGEIWAYGLRNPWRGSFDTKTGDLWVGDVGKDYYEEIDLIEPGENFGWPDMEGNACKDNRPTCNMENSTRPVIAYPHGRATTNLDDPLGVAVIGGHVYRGDNFPELQGKFIFGDYSGVIWSLEYNTDSYELIKTNFLHRFPDLLSSIGMDQDRELIFVGIYQGKLFKLRQSQPIFFYSFVFFYTLALGVVIYRWRRTNLQD